MTEYLDAATRLHAYLVEQHWTGNVLAGPDPGIRFNARIGRFLKSYTPFLPWSDNLVYLQAQGYWILDNWLLFDLTGDEQYRTLAVAASEGVLSMQTADGYWPYPNPEWRGRIATVEGCFGAIGLVETSTRVGDARFLEAALAWYGYLELGIGFRAQHDPAMLAVNYFAHDRGDVGGVPNNSTLVLWLLARLAEATGDARYLRRAEPMARWLADVQVESGELPYAMASDEGSGQLHFLCHQYNAFEFMDLVHYHRITGDDTVMPTMARLAGFLGTGFTDDDFARYDCHDSTTEVPYYSAAVAQALDQATGLGFGDFHGATNRAYARILGLQRSDGGFRYHSRGTYGFLKDRRSYPRYLSMILHHLLLKHGTTAADEARP